MYKMKDINELTNEQRDILKLNMTKPRICCYLCSDYDDINKQCNLNELKIDTYHSIINYCEYFKYKKY